MEHSEQYLKTSNLNKRKDDRKEKIIAFEKNMELGIPNNWSTNINLPDMEFYPLIIKTKKYE